MLHNLGKGDPLNANNRDFQQKMYGVMVGIVTDNVAAPDTAYDKDYRVKVKFPWLGDEASYWARIATVGAGQAERGTFWLPEVNDEVLCAFVGGDFQQPIVIGSLWNGVDKPTYSNKDATGKIPFANFQGKHEAKKNDLRALTSRKYHQLIFNDNASEPKVVLHSSTKHRIVLDDKGNEPNKIEIYDGKEENYILIDTKNKKITIETKTGDMLLKAKNTIRLECKTLETDSQQATDMKVGTNFSMQASSNMSLKANGTGTVQSSGTMTVKGATVNIN
jgi:uncharacterized protein involved in type VI secretion and phage assembly